MTHELSILINLLNNDEVVVTLRLCQHLFIVLVDFLVSYANENWIVAALLYILRGVIAFGIGSNS